MKTRTQRKLLELGRPRSLSGLMGLYESNYSRLMCLIPYHHLPIDEAISTSAEDADLHLRVLERCKFTTTLHLTYWFDTDTGSKADPDLTVRLYHDTHQAEALHCSQHPRCVALRGFDYSAKSVLDAQWGRNLLLNKWLTYLLDHGHGFAAQITEARQAR